MSTPPSLSLAVDAGLCATCAGRDPQPIATVQSQDAYASCTQIAAEIEANNIKVRELVDEQGLKTGQNVAAGVAGVFIPVLWFAMDFKGAASKEVAALAPAVQIAMRASSPLVAIRPSARKAAALTAPSWKRSTCSAAFFGSDQRIAEVSKLPETACVPSREIASARTGPP